MNEPQRILANRYQVGELIGRGGMAEVHIGYDTRLGRTVAIKILRPDLARDPSFQTRFRREAQAAAGLNHPAIVAVYDTGEEQTVGPTGEHQVLPFIVMEYVEGHTVRDILKDGAAAPIEEAVEITAGVLTGLEYAHAAGLVHRDIKPANIMLTPTGAVKVMDFGIARALADVGQTMTQTQAVVGTAQYLSPEQARGENVDARSDLYSTGCVLFELLCGRPPFLGDSPVSVAYQHVREPAPVPSTFAPDVPPSLDKIVARALAKDRNQRYSSAQEFLADLQSAAVGGPLAPATGQYPVGSASAGSGATAVLAAGATGTTQIMPAEGTGEDLDEYVEVGNERLRRLRLILILVGAIVVAGAIVYGLFSLTKAPETGESADMVTVPGVVEQGQDAALAELDGFGLVGEVRGEASEDVAAGLVIRTDPSAGVKVARGSTVIVYVSTGPEQVTVPKVNGLLQEDAAALLESANLVVGEIIADNSDPSVPAGRATKTDPANGAIVAPQTVVNLYVSSGKVQLPDVTGLDIDAAGAKLDALGLPYDIDEVQTDAETPNTVISQDPQPGLVDQGTGVYLRIAVPVVYVEVPDVTGKTESVAKASLQSRNLQVSVTHQNSILVAAGKVISQNPTGGTTVPEGSSVTIVISDGPLPSPSPSPS